MPAGCGPGEQCSVCYYGCSTGCGGGCSGCSGCSGSCKGGCYGCGGCDGSCSGGCTSCSGCSNSCKGTCGRTCSGVCNTGCSGGAADEAFNALKSGLGDYVTEKDLNNIYLIFKAVEARRKDANITTNTLESLVFTKDIEKIDASDISGLKNVASKVGFAITSNAPTQNSFIEKDIIQELLTQANKGYGTSYPRGSIT